MKEKPKKKLKGNSRGQLAELGEEEEAEEAEGEEEVDGVTEALEEVEDELGQMFMLEEQVTDGSAQYPWLNSDPWKNATLYKDLRSQCPLLFNTAPADNNSPPPPMPAPQTITTARSDRDRHRPMKSRSDQWIKEF